MSSSESAPFHMLMATKRPEMLAKHPLVKNDYLARRFRCLNSGADETNLWSAATPVERAIVECCHVAAANDSEQEDEEEVISGSLVKRKEGNFVRLLALYCQATSTRALALAILERTIEQDEFEREDDDDTGVAVKEENDVKVKTEDITETDLDSKPPAKESPEEQQSETADGDSPNGKDDDDAGSRMSRFLATGGLRILQQWLIDAMTPVKAKAHLKNTPPASKQAQSQKKASVAIQKVASPTGPLLLPLLSILKDMPFDKNLVKQVKINKQIRNLKKQLDEAGKVAKKGDDRDPAAGGLSVSQVKQAVESLMTSWEEQNKVSTLETSDPFAALREKMAERVDALKSFERGDAPKPEWLSSLEESERIAKEEKEVSKLTTQQRAARERQQEREQLLLHAQNKQKEAREKMQLLLKKSREESQKRKAEGGVSGNDKKRTRRVRWKDGLNNSDNLRQRKLLEQVHVYPAESSKEEETDQQSPSTPIKNEAGDDTNSSAAVKLEEAEGTAPVKTEPTNQS